MTEAETPLGTIEKVDGERAELRYRRTLQHSPEKVWHGLTESEYLRYWMPCDMVGDRAEGASLVLPFWPDVKEKYSIDLPDPTGEIVVWDPTEVFEWRWDTELLRFELEAVEDGTVLSLTVTLDAEVGHLIDAAGGYHLCLDHLGQLLDTGSAPLISTADSKPITAKYRAVIG